MAQDRSYLIIFLVHNSIIAPRFMLTHRYGRYVLLDLLLIIGVFWMVDLYEKHLVGVLVSPPAPTTRPSRTKPRSPIWNSTGTPYSVFS